MKDAECAEKIEKSIFSFWDMVDFVLNIGTQYPLGSAKWKSLVSVSESASQKSVSSQFPKNIEYKINHISETENRKKTEN